MERVSKINYYLDRWYCMTIKEIKDLTKFLTDEDVDKIKNEIKSKESVLKSQDMDEKEMTQVLNTLFAIYINTVIVT